MSTALPVGDAAGFARLIDTHRSMVCSIALSIVHDVQTSEDVAQDVFLAAWQQLGTLRNPASLVPWLRQITRNRATDRRRTRPVAPLVEEPAADGDPETTVLDHERSAILRQVLSALPDEAREVILLYYREGRSVRQVARLLDLSDAAVKQRLSRARKRIRQDVAERFADAVRETAPTAAFTAAVTAALSVGAPSVAAASVVSKAGATAVKGALFGAVLGPVLGVAGVLAGTRRAMKGARSDAERQSLRRTAWVASALVVGMGSVVAFLPPEPAWLWTWFAVLLTGLALIYRVWVPRIVAPRWAAERAEDPDAARRQQRETWASWAGLVLGGVSGGIGIAVALAMTR